MKMTNERRYSLRLPLGREAVGMVQVSGEGEGVSLCCNGPIRDLSIEGLFVCSVEQPPHGASCMVSITLQAQHSAMELRGLEGTVVRRDQDGFAVHFFHRLEWFALIPIYFTRTPLSAR